MHTYNENVVVNKTVLIVGKNRDTTILDGVRTTTNNWNGIEAKAASNVTVIAYACVQPCMVGDIPYTSDATNRDGYPFMSMVPRQRYNATISIDLTLVSVEIALVIAVAILIYFLRVKTRTSKKLEKENNVSLRTHHACCI